jgi:hypothetical protein
MTEMQVMIATMLRLADFKLLSDKVPRLILNNINTGPDRKIPVSISHLAKDHVDTG